jgi:hypothetical protein
MLRPFLLAAAVGLALIGCGGGGGGGNGDVDAPDIAVDAAVDASNIPPLFNRVSGTDLEIATQASALLGVGGSKNCDRCHALSRERLRSWQTESDQAFIACLNNNLQPTTQGQAAGVVDCLRAEPGVTTSGWPPHKLGLYNTAARLEWFKYVFQLAYGATWENELDLFTGEAAMPRADTGQFTQGEFDIVAEWLTRGMPQLDAVVPADPPPTQCTTMISADVATHVNTMRTEGWRAVNQERGILMFGCQGATDALGCLSTYPAAGDSAFSMGWGDAEPTTTIRVLRENNYASSYWTRSSADGRYVSHGGAPVASQTYRASVIDLQTGTNIPAAALYDPGFFPDNSGFAIQGSNARFCEQSLLATNPAMITFNEAQCRRTTAVGLYQHMAAANGGDYWTIDGQFDNDNGGQINSNNPTLTDTSATFSTDAEIDLTPMVHTGTQFIPQTAASAVLPREGDVIISPSARLLVSRVSGSNGSQSGYIMRKLLATKNGATYTVSVPEIARYCLRGGKPAISFDEKWMVFHHYVEANDWQALGYNSATDPGFVALRDGSTGGAANIFLLDITTGNVRRITTMQPGQYALYPHFRSDGWIYFLVRDRNRNLEWISASNAALVFE